MRFISGVTFLSFAALLSACDESTFEGSENENNSGMEQDRALVSEQPVQDAFWANLEQHCGEAYRGRLVERPEEDRLFTGDEDLVAHFRECRAEELKIPFHVGENRSRTWVLMRTDDAAGLELRHDHRHEDGTEEDNTWYGAFTRDTGTPDRQEFLRTSEEAMISGWRIEIEPGRRYTYGTIRNGEWRYRIDFDLSETVPEPPAPWGHD